MGKSLIKLFIPGTVAFESIRNPLLFAHLTVL